MTTAHADVSMAGAARLLEPYLCVIREFSRVLTRPVTIGKTSPFPLAFSVTLLASSDARRNFSGRLLHSVVLGLPLGRSGRRAGLHENAPHFLLSLVRCHARPLFVVVA
jgi:hypothetical protein